MANLWHRNRKIRDGLYRAIEERMIADERVYLCGEGCHMKVHFDAPSIEQCFPERLITLPISEDGNTNFAVGLAIAGLVPIVDVISSDFLFRTMDSICNTAAKHAHVAEPRTIVIRAEFLTGGPTTGQRIEAMFAHVPGLHVAVPATAKRAHGVMRQALERKGVSLIFEDRMIEDDWDVVAEGEMTLGADEWLIEPAESPTVTTVSYGVGIRLSMQALSRASWCDRYGLDWLYPLELESVLESVRTTNALLIVEPAPAFMGIGAEIAAQVAERLPGTRIKRIGSPREIIPVSPERHHEALPTVEQIRDAAESMLR